MKNIVCYKNNKLVYRIELAMNNETFKKQIMNGILIYNTSDGGTEIINLDYFDKIKIEGIELYECFK